MHLKETLFEKLNTGGPALIIRSNKMLLKKFNAVKNSFEFSADGKCNVKCKFSTMSDSMKRNFEAKGYTMEVETKGGRHIVKSMKMPDHLGGHTIKNGAEFDLAMKNPKAALHFKTIFNSKTTYFLNTKFGTILRKRLGIDKLNAFKDIAKEKAATAKEAVIKKMREALKLPALDAKIKSYSDQIKETASYKAASSKINAISGRFDKVASVVAMVCGAYNVSRAITVSIKVAKLTNFVTFAMLFLKVAEQIKAGDADPDVVSAFGDQLTTVDSNGKTATDSLGYRNIAYSDTGNLNDEQKAYSASGSGELSAIISTLVGGIGLGIALSAFQKFCRIANSVWADAAECGAKVATSTGVGAGTGAVAGLGVGALPGAVVGAATGLGWCVITKITANFAIGQIIGVAITGAIGLIAARELPLLNEETIGENLGNSITTGTSQIMGVTATSYGLKAGSKDEIKQYAIDTAQVRQQEKDIAYYEASKTPFDIYNKYSFLGSIINNSGLLDIYNSRSIASITSNIYSIIPRSMASISNMALAKDEDTTERFSGCQDPNTTNKDLGIATDSLCNPSFIMGSSALEMDSDTVIDFMTDPANNSGGEGKGFVNADDGSLNVNGKTGYILGDPTNPYTIKSDYENYLDNCANRTIPLGETNNIVESEYFDWEVGLNCTNPNSETVKKELPYFQAYTIDKSINDTMDETDTTAVNDSNFSNSISFYDSGLYDYAINPDQIDETYASALTSDVNIFNPETETTPDPITTEIKLNTETQPVIVNAQNTNICNPTSINNRITDFSYLCMRPYINKEYVGI